MDALWDWGVNDSSVVHYSKWSNNHIEAQYRQESLSHSSAKAPLLGDLYRELYGKWNLAHKLRYSPQSINLAAVNGAVRAYRVDNATLNYGNNNNRFFWPEEDY